MTDEVFEHLRHEGDKYPWVWFDSISAYQDIGLDDLWETIIIEKPARKRYGLDKGDYWINMQRLGRFVRDIATLSDSGMFHFGITAWPVELRPNPEDPEVDLKQMPWVQGKNMAMKTCGYVNIVAYGDITPKGTRRLNFMETDHHYAKVQFDGKDGPGTFKGSKYQLLNPTMPKIIDMVKKSGGAVSANGKVTKSKATKATTTRRKVVRRRNT